MAKIIDAFLFFQELDLLEIRLAYLDKYVDQFVIVEACQTFSGNPKKFVFEENVQRFAKYIHKIKYLKINDFHNDYESVQVFLNESETLAYKKISNILSQHNHYSKDHLNWVLDTYHRECIHIALDNIAQDEDVIILSDLDEIPSKNIFSKELLHSLKIKSRVCKQKEFRYFLNYFKDDKWLGSIVGIYKNLKNVSFNLLRIDSKIDRKLVSNEPIESGGYHFTSCGDINLIKAKIASWGHQELNTDRVVSDIGNNIHTGQDIFKREVGTNLTKVSIYDDFYYDSSMTYLLTKFPYMISEKDISVVKGSFLKNVKNKLEMNWGKVIYKFYNTFRISYKRVNKFKDW